MKKFLTKNQLLLLSLFYTNPEKSFYMQELGRILGKKPGVFQRTLNVLEKEGILISEYSGRVRYFTANTKSPFYNEFKQIIVKSAGPEAELKKIVEAIKGIRLAFIYGSFARGEERKDSDIDILIAGDPSIEGELLKKISPLEKKVQREINYKIYTPQEFKKRLAKGDLFLKEILGNSMILLKGNLGHV